MKRTREITIIHYCRRRSRKRQPVTVHCSTCGPEAEMITVAAAAELTGISRSTLYRWIASRRVHAARETNGQLRICHRSLSERMAAGAAKPADELRRKCRRHQLKPQNQ